MDTRRQILAKAAGIAGLTITEPLVAAAAPFVRLAGERGDNLDERARFEQEVDSITEFLPLRTAAQITPHLLALWANLNSAPLTKSTELAGLKAKAATLAGANSITLNEPVDGRRWFSLAHRYARMVGDPGLISNVHSREANAQLYWSRRPQDALTEAKLAFGYADTDERRGMALMMLARAYALMGGRGEAHRAAERSVELARDVEGRSPRTDRWIRSQAHASAARTLASFPEFLPAVEGHVRDALAGSPADAHLLRAQTRLHLSEVHVGARQYERAREVIREVLADLPDTGLQPVLTKEIREIADQARRQNPDAAPVRELTDLAAGLTA